MVCATAQAPLRGAVWELPERLGLAADVRRLNDVIAAWTDGTDEEVRAMVERQLAGRAKRFRPATVFACYRAAASGRPPDEVVRSAAAIELLHNVALIVDDI